MDLKLFGCSGYDQRTLILQKYKLEIKTVVRPKDENDNFMIDTEPHRIRNYMNSKF